MRQFTGPKANLRCLRSTYLRCCRVLHFEHIRYDVGSLHCCQTGVSLPCIGDGGAHPCIRRLLVAVRVPFFAVSVPGLAGRVVLDLLVRFWSFSTICHHACVVSWLDSSIKEKEREVKAILVPYF